MTKGRVGCLIIYKGRAALYIHYSSAIQFKENCDPRDLLMGEHSDACDLVLSKQGSFFVFSFVSFWGGGGGGRGEIPDGMFYCTSHNPKTVTSTPSGS